MKKWKIKKNENKHEGLRKHTEKGRWKEEEEGYKACRKEKSKQGGQN